MEHYDSKENEVQELKNIISELLVNNQDLDSIESLRKEIKTLKASLSAITSSRNSLMVENSELKKQCLSQQKRLKKCSN